MVLEIAAGAGISANNHSLFRLEDVAVGSWVDFVQHEQGWQVQLVHEPRFNFNGCAANDIVSHYAHPDDILCMHQNLGVCCRYGKPVRARHGRHRRLKPGVF